VRFKSPHNSVVAVYRRSGSGGDVEVLLLKCLHNIPRPEDVISYKLPGGKAEAEEIPEETARRELREETGLKLPKKVEPLLIYQTQTLEHVKYGFAVNRASCKGSLYKGVRIDGRTRIVGHAWVSLDRALELIPPSTGNSSHHDVLKALKARSALLT
jgi:ADP-ribose pyrophosphatase